MIKLNFCKQVVTLSLLTLVNTSLYALPQAPAQAKPAINKIIAVKTSERIQLKDIQEGINLVQMTQKALGTILNNLLTMNTLAVQAYNSTDLVEKIKLDTEFQALINETARIEATAIASGVALFEREERTIEVPLYHMGNYKVLLPASLRHPVSLLILTTQANAKDAIGVLGGTINETTSYMITLGYTEENLKKIAADGDTMLHIKR